MVPDAFAAKFEAESISATEHHCMYPSIQPVCTVKRRPTATVPVRSMILTLKLGRKPIHSMSSLMDVLLPVGVDSKSERVLVRNRFSIVGPYSDASAVPAGLTMILLSTFDGVGVLGVRKFNYVIETSLRAEISS